MGRVASCKDKRSNSLQFLKKSMENTGHVLAEYTIFYFKGYPELVFTLCILFSSDINNGE